MSKRYRSGRVTDLEIIWARITNFLFLFLRVSVPHCGLKPLLPPSIIHRSYSQSTSCMCNLALVSASGLTWIDMFDTKSVLIKQVIRWVWSLAHSLPIRPENLIYRAHTVPDTKWQPSCWTFHHWWLAEISQWRTPLQVWWFPLWEIRG